ncbi:MAG: hypothetical protein WC308_02830 [archaeon]|jgi:hypothetical protein
MVEIPVFEGDAKTRAKKTVEWAESSLENRRSILGIFKIGHRTPREIFDSGKIISSFVCLEKTVAFATALKKNGFDAHVVVERGYAKNGKPIGLHFRLDASDGAYKFSVDPDTLRTNFHDGWPGKERSEHWTRIVEGSREIYYKTIFRKRVPDNPQNMTAFDLVGLKNRRGFLRAANVSAGRYIKLTFARIRPSDGLRIEKIKKRKAAKKTLKK